MTLTVRLGEGFKDDTVVVRVDGKPVYGKSGVSTDLSISRADGFDVQTDANSVQLEVSVQGGPRIVRELQPAQTPFVEIGLRDGELHVNPQAQEPPML